MCVSHLKCDTLSALELNQSNTLQTRNMKTRLPKTLLAVLLSVAGLPATQAADELFIDVGLVEDFKVGSTALDNSHLPSKVGIYVHEGDLTLNGTQKVGTLDSSGNFFIAKDTDKYSYVGSKSLFGSTSITPTKVGTVSKNLHVTGKLTINEDAQVSLGGHYYTEIKGTLTTYKYAEYTGLIADDVEVNGKGNNASLQSMSAYIGSLTVNSGLVKLHTATESGNTSFMLKTNEQVMPSDSKQVQIKTALTVNGDSEVIIGKDGANHEATDAHVVTTFGSYSYQGTPTIVGDLVSGIYNPKALSSLITQTGGILKVHGKSASVGGLNIDQQGGVMSISNDSIGKYHFLADYGDSTIRQSGDTSTQMTLGIIKAYNKYYGSLTKNLEENGVSVDINPSVSIEQTGAGTINLNGVYFYNQSTGAASAQDSSITQTGSGIINLNGAYEGANFDVTQTGSGVINMNSSMSLDEVKLDNTTATPTDKESGLVIGQNAVVTVNSITINGGRIVNNGTINGAGTMAMRSAGDTIYITDGELINSGTINASVNMTGGTLVAEAGSEIAGITATGGDILVEGDFTMTGDMILDGDVELIFGSADYTIDLGEYDVVFSDNSSIALTLGDTDISKVVLFTGAKEDYSGYKVTLLNEEGQSTGTAVLEYNADGTVTLGTAAVPEPTSSMLGLMGLVAFTLRRRRK